MEVQRLHWKAKGNVTVFSDKGHDVSSDMIQRRFFKLSTLSVMDSIVRGDVFFF